MVERRVGTKDLRLYISFASTTRMSFFGNIVSMRGLLWRLRRGGLLFGNLGEKSEGMEEMCVRDERRTVTGMILMGVVRVRECVGMERDWMVGGCMFLGVGGRFVLRHAL